MPFEFGRDRNKIYREFTIWIKYSDLPKMYDILGIIDNCEKEGIPVPIEHIKNFKTIIQPDTLLDLIEISSKAMEGANKVEKYLSNKKGFDFNGQSVSNLTYPFPKKPYKGDKFKYEYTFHGILYLCLNRYYEEIRKNKLLKKPAIFINKKTVLNFFKNELNLWSEIFNKKHKKEFSSYKRGIIAALLTEAVGFKLATNQPKTNEEYFQASRG